MTQYFSDRELGETPRTIYGISPAVWQGLVLLVQERVETEIPALGEIEQNWRDSEAMDRMGSSNYLRNRSGKCR